MPIYDYECKDCGAEVTDVFQKVTDPELTTCPMCNEEGLFRVVTGGLHSFMAGSNTVGSIADKNTRRDRNKIKEEHHKQLESSPQQKKQWYQEQGNKSAKEINKMNSDQKRRYIMEG
jgi:putative FmdB family regulatory protein